MTRLPAQFLLLPITVSSIWFVNADSTENCGEETRTSLENGAKIFQQRCSLCHGNQGLGDGRMARIITDPPPYNLTTSMASESYLEDIIRLGGEQVGRSPQMPPFLNEFSDTEIKSIVLHLLTLRP